MRTPPDSPVNGSDARSPNVFVSYAHGDDGWDATILNFATALRTVGGVDADLDKWHMIGGRNWAAYGPAAIEASDVVVLAFSPAYRAAWERKNPPDRNAGVGREAATVQGLFDRDQADFPRRVRIVVLPGSSKDDIPLELLATVERFVVTSFDLAGLGMLLRSILELPEHEKPALGSLPALPAHALRDLPATPGETDLPCEASAPASDINGADRLIADKLAARLAGIDDDIASMSTEGLDGDAPDGSSRTLLEAERSAVEASLHAVERTLPIGVVRQRMVGDYLRAQLYFSAGAYDAAVARLRSVRDRLSDSPKDREHRVFEPCMRELTELMHTLNERMRTRRYAATVGHRHPEPPGMELDTDSIRCVQTYYEVTRCAVNGPAQTGALGVIRGATLLGREEKHAAGMYERFTTQQAIATDPLGLDPPRGRAGSRSDILAARRLHGQDDDVAANVLRALAKAHFELHLVERRRSGPVGAILGAQGRRRGGRSLLRRSIALNTFALAISETLPWMFAAERGRAKRDPRQRPGDARHDLAPFSSDVARPPGDTAGVLSPLPRISVARGSRARLRRPAQAAANREALTRQEHQDNALLTEWVDTLEALAEYRIGELYRADHDYMQALVHLCRSHDFVHGLEPRPRIDDRQGARSPADQAQPRQGQGVLRDRRDEAIAEVAHDSVALAAAVRARLTAEGLVRRSSGEQSSTTSSTIPCSSSPRSGHVGPVLEADV